MGPMDEEKQKMVQVMLDRVTVQGEKGMNEVMKLMRREPGLSEEVINSTFSRIQEIKTGSEGVPEAKFAIKLNYFYMLDKIIKEINNPRLTEMIEARVLPEFHNDLFEFSRSKKHQRDLLILYLSWEPKMNIARLKSVLQSFISIHPSQVRLGKVQGPPRSALRRGR